MPHIKPFYLAALPLAAIGLSGPASAYDPIVVKDGWKQVAYDRDGDCEGEVRGNGKIFLINAIGLGEYADGRYYVTNVDMMPIDWDIVTGPNGEWTRYYIPYIPNYEEGTVNVRISTRACNISMTFDWKAFEDDYG